MLKVSRDKLAAAVGRAAQGLSQNPDLAPIRRGMLLYALDDHAHLSCGDENVIFTARLPLLEETEALGCVLPGKLLTEMVRYLPQQDVGIEIGSQAVFTCGRSSFALSIRPQEEYPMWATPPAPRCTLDGAELAAGLRRVAPAASDDDPMLSGILLELGDATLTLAATDKVRLGMTELPVTAEPGRLRTALLPARIAEKFARACEGPASAGWDDSLVSLHSAGLLASMRQVAGQRDEDGEVKWPPWRGLLDGDRTWHACETAGLVRALRMAGLAAVGDVMGGQDYRAELAFGDGELAVTAGDARQVIDCGYDGKPVTLAVGGRNLLAGLAGCGELVYLSLTAPHRPLLLDSEGLRWLVQTRKER